MGIRIEGLGGIEANFAAQVDEKALVGLTYVGQAVHEQVTTRLRDDLDERGFKGRVDQGLLFKAITAGEPHKDPDGLWRQETGVLSAGDLAIEAAVAEAGRSPGYGVSLEGRMRIRRWVEHKLGKGIIQRHKEGIAKAANARGSRTGPRTFNARDVRFSKDETEALLDTITFLVIRKIRREGIPGLHMFANTGDDLRGGKAARLFEDAVGSAP